MNRLMSFDKAIAESQKIGGKRHLLLGNGFSIACRPGTFRYDRLFENADFSNFTVDASELFDVVRTSDFERVIEALRASSAVIGLYGDDQSLMERLEADRLESNRRGVGRSDPRCAG